MEDLNTKVLAGKVRFSYVHVFEAVSISEGQYLALMLFGPIIIVESIVKILSEK